MLLRGVKWGPVFNASGARGFFGEGYWFHSWAKPFGLDYTGSTFVAKTTTLNSRPGNMALDSKFRPRDRMPGCIVVKMRKGVVLNSVGLSGPGADVLIPMWSSGKHPNQPWMVSFMSVAPTSNERVSEAITFFEKMQPLVRSVGTANLGLQINFSCPNVGLDVSKLTGEVFFTLDAARNLGIPVLIKLNATVHPTEVKKMMEHPTCDGFVMSNTIPWGKLPEDIDWEGLFGKTTSPLSHLGGGGLSGEPLCKIVGRWIQHARLAGIDKPIVACGGVLSVDDAEHMLDCGADGIELGSVSILRPWRVREIIRYVNTRMG